MSTPAAMPAAPVAAPMPMQMQMSGSGAGTGTGTGYGYGGMDEMDVPPPSSSKGPLIAVAVVVGLLLLGLLGYAIYAATQSKDAPPPPKSSPGPSEDPEASTVQPVYVGCFKDADDRRMTGYGKGFTQETCAKKAAENNQRYFAIQYGTECWGSNDLARIKSLGTATCDMKDAAGREAGGSWAQSVFDRTPN